MTSAPGSNVHAAIDIGTNSFHLVVAQAGRGGGFEILTREKESVRLGHGAGEMSELTADAIDRGVAALKRFRRILDAYRGAKVSAVATSAVREARNRAAFLNRARREAGINVEVISGAEEARLIRLGVIQALPIYDRRHLVVDIGGGSTEFIVGKADQLLVARSVKIGAIRLTDRFFEGGVIKPKAVRECRDYIRSYLEPIAHEVDEQGYELAAGSSGTILALASIIEARRGREPGRSLNRVEIDAEALDEVVDALVAAPTAPLRSAIAGLDARRADIIVGGALLLQSIFRRLSVNSMIASEYALREGVLFDSRRRTAKSEFHHLGDIRGEGVQRMVDRYERDRPHVEHATDLALRLFDATAKIHGLTPVERELLEAAGLLHNVGLFISHSSHHKHSYYLIRNSDLLVGFTDHERELMAQVARYHRKSLPSTKHAEFAALDESDHYTVRVLSGLLRIAIALDRTHSGSVRDVRVRAGARISITALARRGADVSVELYAAAQRKDLAELALDRPISVSATTA